MRFFFDGIFDGRTSWRRQSLRRGRGYWSWTIILLNSFLMFQELIDLWSTHWFADLPTILCVHYAQVDPLTIAAEDCGAVLGSLRHSDDWCMSELWTPCRLWLWTSCQRRLTQRSEMRALFSLALSIHRPSHLDATRTLSPLHLRWLF